MTLRRFRPQGLLMLTVALAFPLAFATSAYGAHGCGTSLDLTFREPPAENAVTSDGGGPYLGAAGLDCSGKMSSLFAGRAIHMELTRPTNPNANPPYPIIAATVFGNLGIWGFPDTVG